MLNAVFHLIFLLGFPLIFAGIINQTKAKMAGRKGPSTFQTFYDLRKLLKKDWVLSQETTWIFQLAPTLTLGTVVFAGLIVPMGNQPGLISFPMDFVLFSYVLGMGKFFMILAAMDTGSPFEGMGASREATFSALIEPAFFILIGTCALIAGHSSFSQLFELGIKGAESYLIYTLSFCVLFFMLLIEGSRVPIDDPNTHLELTMIHEVMVLDHSGPDLGLILYGSAVRLVVWAALLSSLLVPENWGFWQSYFGITIIFVGTAIAIGLTESAIARLKLSHVPMFLISISILSLLVLVTFLI